jgi:arsenate reductase (thioredoxin)
MADRPSVLFVCVHNAGRSQMAAGWLRHLAGESVEVRSAGSIPGHQVNPAAVEAMREVGIDITDQKPKILEYDTVESSDVLVTMGCGDACPYYPANATRTGRSTTPQARASTRCVPSVTTSRAGSKPSSVSCRPRTDPYADRPAGAGSDDRHRSASSTAAARGFIASPPLTAGHPGSAHLHHEISSISVPAWDNS